jgi:transposase InsO family protein
MEKRDGVAYFGGVASWANNRVVKWAKEEALVAAAKYKPVDRKVRPVPGVMPEEARTVRTFPSDPLEGYTKPDIDPPPFVDGERVTRERLNKLDLFKSGFLWPQEVRIAEAVLKRREKSLAFSEADKGRFRDDYFTGYKFPVIPHEPWQEKPIPLPPAWRPGIHKLFKEKVANGTYEPTQSSYCSKWFAIVKKTGEFRIVHDLQPLNAVTIRDAGVPPAIEEFVEDFAGRACYSLLDIFVGFDNRTLHPLSRDLTAFMGPDSRMYRLCVLPMGGANCVPEFQACMVFILQDEIPEKAGVFVDDVGIKGGRTRYELSDGSYETMRGFPGVRRFVYEHLCDVDRILARIGHSGATVSAKKLILAVPEAVIVGHKCTYEGRLPDDSKVSKVLKWPRPKNTTEIRGFLGLCACVRMFIKDYAKISRPLNDLLCKDVEWEWTDRQEDAMARLKVLVSEAPCLVPIDYTSDREVIFAVDSSYIAVGYVLLQIDVNGKRRPARYGSLTFNERESRYSQAKLELYGLYRAIKKMMLYLVGIKHLVIEVDAKYIKGMLNSPDQVPSATLNRWIEGILMLPFTLRHVKAAKHLAADGLSRRPRAEDDSSDGDEDDSERETMDNRPKLRMENEVSEGTETNEQKFEGAFLAEVDREEEDEGDQTYEVRLGGRDESEKSDEKADEEPRGEKENWSRWLEREHGSDLSATRAFLERLTQPDDLDPLKMKNFISHARHYFLRGDRLYRRQDNGLHQLMVKRVDRGKVLRACHDELGHKGIEATEKNVSHRFWWKGFRADVEKWVKSCVACQKRSEVRPVPPVASSRPSQLFRHIYIDCMNMPKAHGKTQIIAARDDLSGYIEARMVAKATARLVAAFLFEDIICRWGMIEVLTSDNGSEFVGEAVDVLVKKYGIDQIKISPYNSRASGVVERGHRTFREALIRNCDDPLTWPTRFYHTLWAERITIRASTGYSPFYLATGYQPCLPIDAIQFTFAWDAKAMSHTDLVAERARLLMRKPEDEERASQVIAQSRWKTAARWNKEHRAVLSNTEHAPGTLVLIRNSAIEKELNRKHKARWLGPMVVVRRTIGGSYVCAELSGVVSRLRFAAFRVKPFISRDGLTFDVEQWLGKEKIASIESELLDEESNAQAWSMQNGDESTDDSDEEERQDDGKEAAEAEGQALKRIQTLPSAPRTVFDGVLLPRMPNLPRFTREELGAPPDLSAAGILSF